MKVIAFFDLKKDTDIDEFNRWVVDVQTKVFEANLPKIKNFKVFKLVDSDNYRSVPHMVQIFNWEGTAREWRKVEKSYVSSSNKDMVEMQKKWTGFCDSSTTQILYADDI